MEWGAVSDDLLPELTQDMLAASVKHKAHKAHGAALSSLYNSIFSPREGEEEKEKEIRFKRVCADRPLWCQLMLSLVSGRSSNSEGDQSSVIMEWIDFFMEKLLEKEAVHELLLLLGPRKGHVWTGEETEDPVGDYGKITHEQVIFVQTLQSQWADPRLKQPGGVEKLVPARSLQTGGDVWQTAHTHNRLTASCHDKANEPYCWRQ